MKNQSQRCEAAAITEIESLLTEDQRRTQTITVDQHHAFREHCREVLTELGRIEREADLLGIAKREGSKQ